MARVGAAPVRGAARLAVDSVRRIVVANIALTRRIWGSSPSCTAIDVPPPDAAERYERVNGPTEKNVRTIAGER